MFILIGAVELLERGGGFGLMQKAIVLVLVVTRFHDSLLFSFLSKRPLENLDHAQTNKQYCFPLKHV